MVAQFSAVIQTKPLTAREFCQKHLARQPLDEQSRGYRAKCVRFLAYVLQVPERTVKSWGSGLDFNQMPDWVARQLAYLDRLAEAS